MSHGDQVSELADGFHAVASSDTCPYAASANEEKKIYTLQFHPEVRHSVYGNDILKNFVFEICEAQANWSMHDFIDVQVEKIRAQVKDDKVLLEMCIRDSSAGPWMPDPSGSAQMERCGHRASPVLCPSP